MTKKRRKIEDVQTDLHELENQRDALLKQLATLNERIDNLYAWILDWDRQ